MTHAEKVQRNAQIFEDLRGGAEIGNLATKYKLHPDYIMQLARNAGIIATPSSPVRLSTYQIIAALCKTDDSLHRIAILHGTKRSYINYIYQKALTAGIPVRHRP